MRVSRGADSSSSRFGGLLLVALRAGQKHQRGTTVAGCTAEQHRLVAIFAALSR